MNYTSTRDKNLSVSSAYAIVNGISVDGGLFVPESFPILSKSFLKDLIDMDYPERAGRIMKLYLDDFTEDELVDIAKTAYSSFDGDPCPLVNIDENVNILELWHGPTCAFKDMALTVLPYLLTKSKQKLGSNDKTLILVATSGDTGKAALEGFKDVDGVSVMVLYPSEGVSEMQKRQMQTQLGDNVCVCAINGNFDDAQTAVKKIFTDKKVKDSLTDKNIALGSANSINWGRLLPQICYYVSAYCDLISSNQIKDNDKFNVVIPTGNFGNILACIYAKKMGIPIDKIICASNENNVLTDFFNTGTYDVNRKFYKTISPSMDILISSNLERLLFEIFDRDDKKIQSLMDDLSKKGKYEVNLDLINKKIPYLLAGYALEDEVSDIIRAVEEVNDYVLDPHTGVAYSVYDDYYVETNDDTVTVIVSTASPYKFPCVVNYAITAQKDKDEFKALNRLEQTTGLPIPEQLKKITSMPIRFDKVIDKQEIEKAILDFIGDIYG